MASVQMISFKHADGETQALNLHTEACGLYGCGEPKPNVWLKIDLLKHKRLAMFIYLFMQTHS